MWSYLDATLGPASLAEFDQHLDTCVRCCGELEFSRHVRERVATSDSPAAMPPEVRSRFERMLMLDPNGEPERRR